MHSTHASLLLAKVIHTSQEQYVKATAKHAKPYTNHLTATTAANTCKAHFCLQTSHHQQHTNLGKSVEDATNRGGIEEADGSQAQGSHGGVVDAPAGLPPCQQVDDGSDSHQANIPQPKADVASQVLPSWITNIEAYRAGPLSVQPPGKGECSQGHKPPPQNRLGSLQGCMSSVTELLA